MTLSTTKTQQLQNDCFTELLDFFVISFTRYEKYDLDSLLRDLCFIPVSLYVLITIAWEYLTSTSMIVDMKVLKPIVHPALLINEELQKLTVKNLRELQSFPKNYKKQDIINALLITC